MRRLAGSLLVLLITCARAESIEPRVATTPAATAAPAAAGIDRGLDGPARQRIIREQLSVAFKLYGEPPIEDNDRRAAGVLAMLRAEFGVDDIATLGHMNDARWLGEDFRSAAALSCATLMRKAP